MAVPSLEERIAALLRHDVNQLDTFLATVAADASIQGTQAKLHCSVICPDGNGIPRVGDFAQWLAQHVVDYAIPRDEIAKAREFDAQHNTTRRTVALATKARQLFTKLEKTGEGGELLVYTLAQTRLRLPQLFCKMSYKTNSQMHVHGTDGIHVGLDVAAGRLAFYWCESKLYKSVAAGVAEALDSIKSFVCPEGGSGSATERDLALVRDNLALNDPDLEYALLRYLDKDDPYFNSLQYRGICLVGFDYDAYPTAPPGVVLAEFIEEARRAYQKWLETCRSHLDARPPLNTIHLEVFLVPFPSVDAFRAAFLKELSLT